MDGVGDFALEVLVLLGVQEFQGARCFFFFHYLETKVVTYFTRLKTQRRQGNHAFLLLIHRTSVPIQVKSSQYYPPQVKLIVLKPLFLHIPIVSNEPMLLGRGLISRHLLIGDPMLLSAAFVLHFH